MIESRDPVVDWLLDSDPSIRWQVMRDLTDTPAEIVAAERARVATEGWGARLLDAQRPDGQWGDGVATPFWWTNMYTLLFLRDLGIDPANTRVRTAIDRVRDVTWGPECGKLAVLRGRGRAVHQRSRRRTRRVLRRTQRSPRRPTAARAARGRRVELRGATVCALIVSHDDLRARRTARVRRRIRPDAGRDRCATARPRVSPERRLLRRASTGEIVDAAWTQLAFPTLWHYDVLRALDYLRAAGVPPDERVDEAVAIVRERRQPDGRWLLDVRHRDTLYPEFAGDVGAPNRWITLRALRVLDWHDSAPGG